MQNDKIGKAVIVSSVILSLLAILFATQIDPHASIASKGQWGDFINGLASPFLLFSAAVLAYLNIKEQILANREYQKRIIEEKIDKTIDSKIQFITLQVNQIKTEIAGIEFEIQVGVYNYGHKALFEYAKRFGSENGEPRKEDRYILDRIYYFQFAYIRALVAANAINIEKEENKQVRRDWINYVLAAYAGDLKKYVGTILENAGEKNHLLRRLEEKQEMIERFMKDVSKDDVID